MTNNELIESEFWKHPGVITFQKILEIAGEFRRGSKEVRVALRPDYFGRFISDIACMSSISLWATFDRKNNTYSHRLYEDKAIWDLIVTATVGVSGAGYVHTEDDRLQLPEFTRTWS